jgi:hypothetical protein
VKETFHEINSTPLSEEEFMEILQIAFAAKAGRLRAFPPDPERCLEDAPPGSWWLTDCPENQMGMAVVGHCNEKYGDEPGRLKAQSFLMRNFAVSEAIHQGLLKDFIRPEPGTNRIDIHDAVFKAAASLPLNKHGRFEPDEYLLKIRDLIRREEAGS